jgi:hypothetical protein
MFDMMIYLGIQNFLKINKIPYLITCSMGMEDHLRNKILSPEMLNQIYKKRFYTNPSFVKFVKENSYKIGPMLHPLEEGHAAWADHLLKHIDQNNLFDNSDL